jgi:hypothetical protein
MVDPPANGVMMLATLIMTDTLAGVQLDGSIPSIVPQLACLTTRRHESRSCGMGYTLNAEPTI